MKKKFVIKRLMFLTVLVLLPVFTTAVHGANYALYFDGNDDATVAYDNTLTYPTSPYTIELWAKINAIGTEQVLVQQKSVFALKVNTTGNVDFTSISGTAPNLTSTGTLTAGQWYHIAIRFDNSTNTLTIFIDGVSSGSATNTDFALSSAAEPILFGNNQAGTLPLTGSLDEIRIWNVARTDTEIQTNMGTSITGPTAGLFAGYTFDNTTTPGEDISGNNLDATLNGATQVLSSSLGMSAEVDTPSGNTFGSPMNISWVADASIGNVHILFSIDGGSTWKYLAFNTDNDGAFNSYIPGIAATGAIIRVLNPNDTNEYADTDPLNFVNPGGSWVAVVDVEAEDGTLVRPMQYRWEGTAFDCAFIDSFKDGVGTMDITVNVPQDGVYVIWGRAMGMGSTRDSWYISVDGGMEYLWDTTKGAKWVTQQVSHRGPQGIANIYAQVDPVHLTLSAGSHTIQVRSREKGTRLDRIIMTNSLTADYSNIWPTPWIDIQAPLFHTDVTRGKPYEIKWDQFGMGSHVTIELCFTYGEYYSGGAWPVLIVQNTPNDGSYTWNVPNYDQDIGFIRITNGGARGVCPFDANWDRFFFVDPEPEIFVTAPNGGEQWKANTNHIITWTSKYHTGEVNIDYSIDNGTNWTTIATNQPSSGSYTWTVPNTPSDLCLVKVYDPTDGNPSDVSDAVFEILPPDLPSASITVMDPNGGENIYAGSVYEVQWQATNFSDLVNIDLSVDNGQTWSTIATDQAATGTYSWNVPGVTTSTALIRVYDKTDQVPSDTSDNVFTILPPQQPSGDELIVTYPNGGEELIAGRTYKLQWDSDGYTGEVKVSVSVDSGATWTELADNQPDSGSFAWQVPMIGTSKGLVKVADAVDGDPMDISDAPFSIIPQPPVEEDYALSFDGMDDFVEIPNDPSLNISENFTIEFWIKTDNPQQAWTRVLEKGSWDQYYIGFYNNHGRMHGALRTKDGENDTKMTIPVGPAYTRMVANEWYHVAATYDGQFAKIYINGILESTKEAEVQPREVTGELILGAVKRLNGYEYHMDAVIDEMRFWNQARSVDDIVDEMYTELTGTESNLAAYYSFNEGSGQMLNDLSANGNHGRLGMTTLADGSDPTWVPSDRPTTPAPERAGEQLAKDASGFDTQGMPEEFGLMQNYPNPFNAGTTISFNIPDSEYGDQTIRLMIFDLQGRVIKTLTQGSYQPGRHQVYWDGSTDDGEMAASGVYFYRLIAGDYSVSKRMVMLK